MMARSVMAGLTMISALALVPTLARAQVVQGRITDESGTVPLSAAQVSLLASDGSVAAVVLSDPDGRYRISPPEPGNYSLRVDLLGYEQLGSPLLLLEGGIMLADFEMPAAPIELEGLSVEAEAMQRIRDDLGRFGVNMDVLGERYVDRAAIEARPTARDFGHVLQYQSIPGIRVARSEDMPNYLQPLRSSMCVTISRNNRGGCALVVLDGALITAEAAATIPVHSLQGIAVLTPPEATQRFGIQASGGAVLLFTR